MRRSSQEPEPKTPAAVAAWIAKHVEARDRFRHIREATEQHRREHGCDAYPTAEGPLLGVLAAASRAERLVEFGCGLGYSGLWLAYGAGPKALVESVDHDPLHVRLARRHIHAEGFAERVRIIESEATAALGKLEGPYDLILFDADIPSPALLGHFARLVRSGGLLISSNLFVGQYVPGLDLRDGAAYRQRLLDDERWLTGFAGEKAVSVRRQVIP